MHGRKRSPVTTTTYTVLAIILRLFCPPISNAQMAPRFEVDPSWPRSLPERWILGSVGGVCVDAQDNVMILNRRNLTDNELDAGYQAPPVIEFDSEGNVVHSWGNPDVLGKGMHGCYFDHDNNVWLVFNQDGIVQKYSHDGAKLLLQIGDRGFADTSEGVIKGIPGEAGGGMPLNSSHTRLYRPSGIAVDSSTGDVYVAEGEEPGSNHRLVLFDRNGRFLRQWGVQRTKAEAEAGEGDEFMLVVHCIAIGNDGLVYACDRRGDRIQVFDKTGNFQKNIFIPYEQRTRYQPGAGHVARAWGTDVAIGFSPGPAQTYMYVANEDDEQIDILDHATGHILSSFGRTGHQAGELSHIHFLAVDSKGSIYTAEVGGGEEGGERVQRFRIAISR